MKATRAFANELILGLVSISDRASQGIYADQGLPGLQQWFSRALKTPFQTHQRLIADDRSTIEQALIELVDDVGCDLVSPVSDQYESPFAFTGTIKRILVDVSDAEFKDLVAMAKVAMAMQ